MRSLFESITEAVQKNTDLTEDEVKDIFVVEGFFDALGYQGFGVDIRSEQYIIRQNRPDYFCKDRFGNTVFVIEFKKPSLSDDLNSHLGQLWEQYAKPLKAKYGVLTDGVEFILYERTATALPQRLFRASLDALTRRELTAVEQLRKPDRRWETIDDIHEFLREMDPVAIIEEVDGEAVGQNDFLDTFRFEEGSTIFRLVQSTFDLIQFYRHNPGEAQFPVDAYEFWSRYYAPSADDLKWNSLPHMWRQIAGRAVNKLVVVFATETVQSLLGRLMLAKACEDYEFSGIDVSRFFVEEMPTYRNRIPAAAPVLMLRDLLLRMRDELVESVFEEDIYFWWTSPAEPLEDASAREIFEHDVPAVVEEFGNNLIELVVAVARFDFSDLAGDPLGQLYQRYFTPQIRKALGEFYTPPSVVRYILDSVGYDGPTTGERLIDPACGSGTFLAEALTRYKEAIHAADSPAAALKDLCERSRIVGLDIHPFAVMLAQIRFMIEILPEYKRAIEEDATFGLKRLPVYRTDTLINESKSQAGKQLSIHSEEGYIHFDLPLPIRKGEDFESITVKLPSQFEATRLSGRQITNEEEYLSAMFAVFDLVKEFGAKRQQYSASEAELTEFAEDYFGPGHAAAQIANALISTANELLATVKTLRDDYEDGRLLKLIEDVVLGITLKNDMKYDYVVGNPPWVSKHSRYSGSDRERWLKSLYLSAWLESDTYMLFVERALQMLRLEGRLGYIVSNRFLHTQGGQEMRAILAKNRIVELVDFTDFAVFEGPINYSLILIVERTTDDEDWSSFIEEGEFANDYEIRVSRVRGWNGELADLMGVIRRRSASRTVDCYTFNSGRLQSRIETGQGRVLRQRRQENYSVNGETQAIVANLPSADAWCLATPQEYEIIERMESQASLRLGNSTVIRGNTRERSSSVVGDNIRQGIISSGKGVYVVEPAARILPKDLESLGRLSVRPIGMDEQFTLETDLLKVFISAKNVKRWIPRWTNRFLMVPYEYNDGRAELVRPAAMVRDYPGAWEFFTSERVLAALSSASEERHEIHARLAVHYGVVERPDVEGDSTAVYRGLELSRDDFRLLSEALRSDVGTVDELAERLWWYRFMRRQNLEIIPAPKLLTANTVQRNRLCFDQQGLMAPDNVRVYSIISDEANSYSLAGVLNSAPIEFYHKQHAPIQRGKAYRYTKKYVAKWPIVLPEREQEERMRRLVEEVVETKELAAKIGQFPDPYIVQKIEEGVEFEEVQFTPGSNLRADPEVFSKRVGNFMVRLGDDVFLEHEFRSEVRARYAAERFREVRLESNRQYKVLVPRDESVTTEALSALDSDRVELESRDVGRLEEEIDALTFELYGINSDEAREIVDRFTGCSAR